MSRSLSPPSLTEQVAAHFTQEREIVASGGPEFELATWRAEVLATARGHAPDNTLLHDAIAVCDDLALLRELALGQRLLAAADQGTGLIAAFQTQLADAPTGAPVEHAR